MEGIIHAFGIDGRLIVIQIFNFALLTLALWYFLYTPVLTLLRTREEKLRKGVEDAEAAGKALSEAEKERESMVRAARTEAETIAEEATAHAAIKGKEIIGEAEVRALRILEDAKLRAQEEELRAQKASEAHIAEAAVLAAERILKNQH